MILIIEAILALAPDSKVSVGSEDYNKIKWHDGNPKEITIEQIKEKRAELQAAYDLLEYRRLRKPEYPSIEECVHAILDDNLEALQVKRKAIKDKYPKPIIKNDEPEAPSE